ncbi:hypothetical protein [Chryseobacterium sp.]|jgi:hypothetical protein|uniref:hypothetical protein n=1 Tax=Chryseobacterium sp. TaxID=1871047 RepID=UPI00283D1784|nr:hypothetical protein [Chryseobacterium sp.]MDR3025597.1 hypothetical protein [Chryseobacterium sp.]
MEEQKKTLLYYLTDRRSKWSYLLYLVLISPLFWYVYYKQSPIEKGNYTIAYARKMYWPIISYKRIEYDYTVKGKNYEATNIYALDPEIKIPARYLVQFSLEDTSFSTIYPNIPVPDSIKEAPPEGWKELPKWAKIK